MKTRVLTNGKFFTSNDNEPWAEAVVLKGNKIAYVGSTKGAIEFVGGDGSIVEDMGGKLVTPGLIDGHLHVYAATMFAGLLRLDGMTPEQMIEAITKDVAEHPDRESYTGTGWFDDAFGGDGPVKADLDAICSENPWHTSLQVCTPYGAIPRLWKLQASPTTHRISTLPAESYTSVTRTVNRPVIARKSLPWTR